MLDRLLDPQASRLTHFGVLLLAGLGLFFLNLGGASLWDVDEGRNCAAALAMWESGDWIVPTFNGELRVDKPPLLYWLQATCYHLFGINEFAARLPSALAALATIFLCYELGRRLFTPSAALLAALCTASCPLVCATARFANPDALLNFLAVLTMLLFWRNFSRPTALGYFLVGITMGLGTLAKGPVGWLLPQTVMLLTLCWTRKWALLLDRRVLLSVAGFCVAAAPWHIAIYLSTKWVFLSGFFFTHNVARFLQPLNGHHGSAFHYVGAILAGFAPWSLLLPLVIWFEARRIKDERRMMNDERETDSIHPSSFIVHHSSFLWCWIGVYVVFFSLSATKLPHYILPVVVPLALLTGRFLSRWQAGEISLSPRWWSLACAGLVFLGVIVSTGLLWAGELIQLPFIKGRTFPGLAAWAPLGLLLVGGGILAALLGRRERRRAAIATLLCCSISFLTAVGAGLIVVFNDYKAPKHLVQQAAACQRGQEIRIGGWQIPDLASLTFYCQRDVFPQEGPSGALELLQYPVPVFLFLPERAWREIEAQASDLGQVVACRFSFYRNEDVLVVANWYALDR